VNSREAAPLVVHLSTLAATFESVLKDISATGARVCADSLPELGKELYFNVLDVKTFATVKWLCNAECGLQFYEPLLQRDVIRLRREAAQRRGIDPLQQAACEDWVLGVAR